MKTVLCARYSCRCCSICSRLITSTAQNAPCLLRSTDQKGLSAVNALKAQDPDLDLVYHQLDIDDEKSVASFAAWSAANFAQVHVLVNNAAIAFKAADPTPFPDQIEPTLRTNVYRLFYVLSFSFSSTPSWCLSLCGSMYINTRNI